MKIGRILAITILTFLLTPEGNGLGYNPKSTVEKKIVFEEVGQFNDGGMAVTVLVADNHAYVCEFDLYISPDESMLIFTSERPEGLGSGDLYISFKDEEGNWSKAKNVGDKINTSGSEYCSMISPDGKYLFFTSAVREGRRILDQPFTYEDFKRCQKNAKNGLSDIYWVDAEVIETLKN